MNIKELNAAMKAIYHAAGYTGKNIVFAVLDTGVSRVGKLRGRVIGDDDTSGHGTFTAGILLDWCPDALIWSYKCPYPDDITAALLDVIERAKTTERRVIVNASISTDAEKIKPAVDACVAAGIPLICAAGNDGREMLDQYPSCFESPITVAALQEDGKRAYFSTWHGEVDFADDGVMVESIDLDGQSAKKSGTSFATPTLAGKAGLLLSAEPDMTEPVLYEMLKIMAFDLGATGRDPYTGYGFVQFPEPVEAPKDEDEKEDEGEMGDRILKLKDEPRMSGKDVKELQKLLDKRGFPCGEVDGIFGPATDEAVRAFQSANSLNVDGKVGPKTWAALRAAAPIDRAQLAADMTAWMRMMVGWRYIIGAQGHEVTREYLDRRYKDHKAYFSDGRYEWVRAEIDRAAALGCKLYAVDCSGLLMLVNSMMGFLPVMDATADGIWTRYCTEVDEDDIQPGDILFRESGGKMVHMAVVGTDGVYEAAGTAYGVVFRPWSDMYSRRTFNRMTGKFDTLKPWTHYGRLEVVK